MYQELDSQLQGRCRESRKVGNNTYLRRRGDAIAVRLHSTDVLTFAADGSVTLDSGGWRTVTTKERMNRFLRGPRVYQENSVLYVAVPGPSGLPYADDARRYYFEDGMTIGPDGTVTGAELYDPAREKETRRLKAAVNRYCKSFVAAFVAGKVPRPGGGDCWGCCMVADNGRAPMGGADHIRSHLEERYYVPSLLHRAVEAFPVAPVTHNFIASFWAENGTKEQREAARSEWIAGIATEQIQKSLRRFCYRELGLAA